MSQNLVQIDTAINKQHKVNKHSNQTMKPPVFYTKIGDKDKQI